MSEQIISADHEHLNALAAQVTDPEIPVLTIADLGILRGTEQLDDGTVQVTITPTYSGCPAMDVITQDLYQVFAAAGYPKVDVKLVLSPAWSTDWMSEEGKRKLDQYGIAPPTGTGHRGRVTLGMSVKCPRCHSLNTRELSRFGSTACKALYSCNDCLEPFDYFKVLS
ncbi:phenylacetate-CoA oxygenase subunit PaaJ [Glutamicibacter sp. MNS18]|uniref:1,2-phenylacetyl-CoA epoxidase subunit PaaD n=1 Tax=Glutamicibacter sp. MNS18 TaxID=2989817 RepID=UPI002235B91C|nr:1,2-phenylacetyl-CoA epoxidase subunit PaaD [Glutamicibacter sp. MNS18]MCW4464066.1 phenylacetate-CoA oxygenase subunit PaaJ [Glutamicibacter sp. MNS18]